MNLHDKEKFDDFALRLKAGDKEAGGKIFDHFSPLIYRYFMARTLNQQLSEDLTQEVFLKLVSRIETFDNKLGNFSGWIWRISKNTLIDYFRDIKETNFADIPEIMENIPSTENDLGDKLKIGEVLEIVKKNFDEEAQEIFSLYYLSDLPYKEIGKITGKTEGNLRVVVHRVTKKIKEILK